MLNFFLCSKFRLNTSYWILMLTWLLEYLTMYFRIELIERKILFFIISNSRDSLRYHKVMIYLFRISLMKYLTCMQVWYISDLKKIAESMVQETCDKIVNNNRSHCYTTVQTFRHKCKKNKTKMELFVYLNDKIMMLRCYLGSQYITLFFLYQNQKRMLLNVDNFCKSGVFWSIQF